MTKTESNELAIVSSDQSLSSDLVSLVDSAQRYAAAAKAPNTLKAYKVDWRDFSAWCSAHRLDALPATPPTVALYITRLIDYGSWLPPARGRPRGPAKVSTLVRRLAAISKHHQAAGLESPCAMRHAAVKEVLDGIKRTKGTAQTGKDPLLTEDLRQALATLPDNLQGKRDRALVLVGFAGGFRRAELVALDVVDVDFASDGLKINLQRSKTDQEGQGRRVGVPYGSHPELCPVRSLRIWLDAAGIGEGPIFRGVTRYGRVSAEALTNQVVALVIKRICKKAGLDPVKFAGHSLRSGHVTQASMNDATERSMMKQTGHKSMQMLWRYIREANLFRHNSATKLGL